VAALLHCGPGAALSGDVALAHFGVKRLTVVEHHVALAANGWAKRMEVPQLVVAPHRVTGLQRWAAGRPLLLHVHVHAAVLHAAAWAASDEEAERRLTMSVQQGRSTPMAIRVALEQMRTLRRRALVEEVLDDIELGATASSELGFIRLCRRHDLPEPDEMQVAVRAGGLRHLDARHQRQRIRVELDGGHHRWVEFWEADTLRSLHLVVQAQGSGEQQIRLTRGMMRHHEQEAAGLLRQLLL
jgi:hypothetical protein